MSLFLTVRGRGPRADQDSDQTRDLNQPCRSFISATKEDSHGEEEEESEDEDQVAVSGRRPPRIGAASDLQISRGPRSRQAAERCSAAFAFRAPLLTRSAIARQLAVDENINHALLDLRMRSFILREDFQERHQGTHAAAMRRDHGIARE